MLENPYRGRHQPAFCANAPFPSINAEAPLALLGRCPEYGQTPLHRARLDGIAAEIFIKDERGRMGLGSFKALGAAYVIAHMAQAQSVKGRIFATASAGNHGLSLAMGARIFGAKAVVFLSETVPEAFARRLAALGADVRRAGADYEESMTAAMKNADEQGWILLSDSSWEGYFELPHRLMEGYTVLAAETAAQMSAPPTHIFLQAGVGGLAAACAAYFRFVWQDKPRIFAVEPEAAPALYDSIKAGAFTPASGPVSSMGRLDCKEASLIALNGLARDADGFILLSDSDVEKVINDLAATGFSTSPSGGAGLAAAIQSPAAQDVRARILCILSEGA